MAKAKIKVYRVPPELSYPELLVEYVCPHLVHSVEAQHVGQDYNICVCEYPIDEEGREAAMCRECCADAGCDPSDLATYSNPTFEILSWPSNECPLFKDAVLPGTITGEFLGNTYHFGVDEAGVVYLRDEGKPVEFVEEPFAKQVREEIQRAKSVAPR